MTTDDAQNHDARSYYDAVRTLRSNPRGEHAFYRFYQHNYGEFLPSDKTELVLDLGCSDGIALRWLSARGYTNIVGVDSDAHAVEIARQSIQESSAQIVATDILSALRTQATKSVHCALMLNVIEHLEKDYLRNVLRELVRVLVPQGVFVAQTGNIENPINFGLFARDFTHEIAFSANSLRQAVVTAGFAPSETRVQPVRYPLTWRNVPLAISSRAAGSILRLFALSMRIRIDETAPLIFVVTRNSE